MNKKVTIKDVAKYANVSPSTVSRVVSKKGKIGEKTTNLVLEAIEKLGYVPNYNARSLVSSSTDTVAVLVDRNPRSLNNSYFTDVLQAIANELNNFNKELLPVFTERNSDEKDRVKNLIETNRIDGVIKLSVVNDDVTINYLASNQIPSVVIGNPENKGKVLWVDNDNEQAMYEVVDSLMKDGYNNLCFVGGSNKFIVTRDRLKGFVKAHKKRDLEVSKEAIYNVEFTEEDAYRHSHTILSKDYDAIVCTDDMIALGILRRANEIGKKIQITGFNNSKEVQYASYPISTVDIKTEKLGRWAVKLLIASINGDETVTNKIIKTEFIKK